VAKREGNRGASSTQRARACSADNPKWATERRLSRLVLLTSSLPLVSAASAVSLDTFASMATGPYHPQARNVAFEEEPRWPHDRDSSIDYSRPLQLVFNARLSYCQRLAAHLAHCPDLGYGWLSITLARLAPLFDQGDAPVTRPVQMARRYVLDRLWWTRSHLEAARTKDSRFTEYDQIGWIARVLVSRIFAAHSLESMTETDAPCLCSFSTIHMRYTQTR
jgi:hypothetical protein